MTDIDEVKSRLNVIDVVGQRVKLKRAGKNFKGLCPFHTEKTPSFIVSPDRQSWHCFGCGKGGSVIDFVMEYEHLEFSEALEELADRVGVKLERHDSDTPEVKRKRQLFEVNHLASEYYHYLLTKHALGARGRDYLKERGVSDKAIATFTLGYSPNSWDALHSYLRKKGYDDRILNEAGLVIASQKGGYDRFRGRVMFTLKDHRGNVVGFSGRLLDPEAKEAKYINTSETPVYSKSNVLYGLDITKGAIQKANEAVIMEGEFDVISSFQEGITNVVAIKGSALTEGHIHLLRRYAEQLTFALDSDIAGDAASRRGIELAEKAGLHLKVVKLPIGKDPHDALRENPVLVKKAILQALPVYDYLIDSAKERFDTASAWGKKKAAEELVPFFSRIENAIVQAHYVKKLAGVLSVPEESVAENLEKYQKLGMQNTQVEKAESTIGVPLTREEKIELYVLACICQGKTVELFEELSETVSLEAFSQPAIRRILELLSVYLKDNPTFLLKDFLDSLPTELTETINHALLWDLSGVLENDELMAREWLRAFREFRRTVLKHAITDVAEHLKKLESDEIEGNLTEQLHETMTRLTHELMVLEK